MPATARRANPDLDDDDLLLKEMAEALDVDPDDLNIKPERGLSSFGVDAMEVTIKGSRALQALGGPGGKEWIVVADEDAARELALAVVKQDLEQEPEIFNKSFIESHIDTDRLRRDLSSDVENMAREDLDEDVRHGRPRDMERILEEADGEGIDVERYRNDEGDWKDDIDEIDSSVLDALAEKRAEQRLQDPLDYLSDIYGKEDAVKQAIKIAGIDVDAAAEEAVQSDGWQHFLCHYDGNSHETKSGFVYWRTD